jgi:choline dehydrogenase-like flavoprotein
VRHAPTPARRHRHSHEKRGRLPEELAWGAQGTWLTRRLGAIVRHPVEVVSNVLRHRAGKPKRFRAESILLEVRTEQEPNPESRVTLADSIDPFGHRRARLHWALTERDKRTVRVAADAFRAEAERLGLGRLHAAPWLSEDRTWSSDLVGGHHHMGTTRMSDDPRTGVVDRDCRTHAVDNLYIAGSSAFPTASYVNPTATLLALAVRLADLVERRAT